MVAGVRISDCRIFAGSCPIKFTGINDQTAKGSTVTAEEFGSRMYHDICTVFNRTDKIGCTKGVIHNQWQAIFMSKFCQRINIRNITVGVSEGFNVDRSCIILNSCLNFSEVMDIYETGGNTEVGKCVRQQIIATAVNGLLCNKMTAVLTESFKGVCNCCCAGSERQGSNAALKGCHTLFENILRGVSESSVDVTCIGKTESSCRMSGILKHIRSGCINRYCTGIGGGIGIFLTYMKLEGFKFIIRHNRYFLSLLNV